MTVAPFQIKLPTETGGLLPNDAYRTWKDLEHWLNRRGSSIRQRWAELHGGDLVSAKKRHILALPVGTPRPAEGTQLTFTIHNYTHKDAPSYDPVFEQALRERHPDWLGTRVRQLSNAQRKKAELRALLPGAPRPKWSTELGRSISGFTNTKQPSYDAALDRELRTRHPTWFSGPGCGVRGPKTTFNVQQLFSSVDKVTDPDVRRRDRVLLDLLFVLGLRKSAIIELDVEHFNPTTLRLSVLGKKKQKVRKRISIIVPATVAADINTYLAGRGLYAHDAPLVASHDRNKDRGDGRLTGTGVGRRLKFLVQK